MNSLRVILKKLRNQLPYFLLIAIYFFFVNLEARKDSNYKRKTVIQDKIFDNELKVNEKQLRIKIPVIPYKQ